MRILHCIGTLCCGGTQRQLSYLAPALAAMGHDVHVAYLHDGPGRFWLQSPGVTLHPLRETRNHDPRLLAQVLTLVRKVRPDILHTWLLQMDVIGCIAASLTDTPWVIAERSSSSGYPSTIKFRIRRALGRRAAAVISNSLGGDAYWSGRIASPHRHVIPNGIHIDDLPGSSHGAPADFDPGSGKKTILYLGRFDYGKNLENLVLGVNDLLNGHSIEAVLAGDGPVLPAIRRLVNHLAISNSVILPGFVENPRSLMKRADVFVSVTEFEGFPNSVMEAMASGCPLVVSDIAAHREILDESCALFVDPSSPAGIADALRATLSEPQKARIRSEAARRRVAGWSVASMATQYEKVYFGILDAKAIGSGGFRR